MTNPTPKELSSLPSKDERGFMGVSYKGAEVTGAAYTKTINNNRTIDFSDDEELSGKKTKTIQSKLAGTTDEMI
jgi:hypothetical protein